MSTPTQPTRERRVLVLVDLAGYAAAFSHLDDEGMAAFTQAYYHECVDALEGAGGRVVKFVGDACLAVFPVEGAAGAVDSVRTLEARVSTLAAERDVSVRMGANMHVGEVMEGHYGPDTHSRYDVIGAAMNDTARMGRGGVLRMSRALLQELPEDERGRWIPESEDVLVPTSPGRPPTPR